LVVIAGPTGVGKTRVAVALARLIPAEVVCADSRTLYRGMDIGTAKPSRPERAAVPHHVLDVASPDQIVTLVDYQRLALRAIHEITSRGRLPLLVGGTGLYIRAVVDRLAIPQTPPDWELRARLEMEEQDRGPGTLHRRLAEVDPAAAARIHPGNVRRIIRALEVYHHAGTPISSLQRAAATPRGTTASGALGGAGTGPRNAVAALAHAGTDRSGETSDMVSGALMVALTMERGRLYERIDRRIEQQLAGGLIEEVRALVEAGYAGPHPAASPDAGGGGRTGGRARWGGGWTGLPPAMQGLGYREIIAYLDGEATLDEAIARLRRNTRRYARRQWTWFRADPRYCWLDVGDDPPETVAARIHAMLSTQLWCA
jgi:tRNA dimethylallyltransferase